MKWLKKWSYLWLLSCAGIVYLSCVDKWQVYAGPWQEVRGWYDSLGRKDETAAGVGDNETAEGDNIQYEDEGRESLPPEGDGQNPVSPDPGDSVEDPQETQAAEDASQSPSEGAEEGSGAEGMPPEDGEASGGNGVEPPQEGETGEPGEETEPKEVTYMTVEDDYFADALFIGDSRTVGLFEYAGLEETATFYASKGLTVYKLFDAQIVSVPGERKKLTVEEGLQQNTFAKIYLMIGINEMGTGTVETFLDKYQEVVAHLRELQPDAVIYLQAIIKVTAARSAQGDYINNEGIVARNEGIARMADDETIFYLDVNPLICGEDGGMLPEYTFDGVHLKAKYIDIWKDFLKSHAVAPWNPEN